MEQVLILIFIFLMIWFLWSGIRCKEIAVRLGQAHCEKHAVQFLDQTVERVTLKLTTDSRRNPGWYRSYQFEFATNGEHRYQGLIVMFGERLQSIKMDPYPETDLH